MFGLSSELLYTAEIPLPNQIKIIIFAVGGETEIFKVYAHGFLMCYVADSQAALDVIILNGNRLVASVGFTFFSCCNLAFTMSFM